MNEFDDRAENTKGTQSTESEQNHDLSSAEAGPQAAGSTQEEPSNVESAATAESVESADKSSEAITEEKKRRPILPILLIVVGIVLMLVVLVPYIHSMIVANRVNTEISMTQVEIPILETEPIYPTDTLFIIEERNRYVDADLVLEVPRMSLMTPVLEGTTQEVFERGVGLYEVSQLPGDGNENVAIAGHRDLAGSEFYDIDKLTDGDLMYLYYEGRKYTYQWESTSIIDQYDWSPIYCVDYAKLTLTSCHPIGVASHRIVAVGALISVEDLPEGFELIDPY